MKFMQAVLFMTLFGTLSIANADLVAGADGAPKTNCGGMAAAPSFSQAPKQDVVRRAASDLPDNNKNTPKQESNAGAVNDEG